MFLVIFVILHQKNSIDLTYTNKHYFFTKKRIFLILVYKSQKSNIGYNLIPISNLNITLSLWPKTQYLHESLVLLDFSFDLCIINSNHCATLKFFPLSLLPIPDHLSLSTYVYLPLYNRRRPTYVLMSIYQHLPAYVNLPSSTYLLLPISKYQYPGAGIGLV